MAIRKIPQRKCVGCNTSKDKKELIRVVRNAEGEISVDLTGKKNGRGAYICREKKCLTVAIKAKRFERAFGCAVDQHVYDKLLTEFEQE